MIKNSLKYNPCSLCVNGKDKYTGKGVVDKKSCPAHVACKNLESLLREDSSFLNYIPAELLVVILRKLGYSGELRTVEVTKI